MGTGTQWVSLLCLWRFPHGMDTRCLMVGSGRWAPLGVVTLRDVVSVRQPEVTLASWGSLCPGPAHRVGTARGRARVPGRTGWKGDGQEL